MSRSAVRLQRGWLVVLGLLAAGCGDDGGSGKTVQLSVSGTASYEDRAYNADGFTGQRPRLPIRFASVQLVDEDGSVLGSTRTSAAGAYSLTASAEEGNSLHVAVVAQAEAPYNVRVVNGSRQVYALATPEFSASAGAQTQDPVASVTNLGGAFNSLDVVLRGCDLLLALRPGATFPALSVFWTAGVRDGTFFTENNEIHLLGGSDDPDEYDDDVILHELGHYMAHNFSWDTSPGGGHNPFDNNPEPLALAWSEGFAHWWTTATRNDPTYVDNNAGGSFGFELETPSVSNVTRGDGNEIAIGAILWDITDPANERHDAMASQRPALWDVVGTFFPSTRPDATIHGFCSGWFTRGHGQNAALGAVFAHRGIACP